MFHFIRKNLSAIVSVTSGVVLVFGTGAFFGYMNWPPTSLIDTSVKVVKDLAKNGAAYFLGMPVQHLRPKRFAGDGVIIYEPEKMASGVTFMTGLFDQKLGARLYASDGTLLHEWPIDFFKIDPESMSYPFDALIHGDHLYESGDFIANLDGREIVRVSACGDIVWRNRTRSHHSLSVDDQGFLWTPIYTQRYEDQRVTNAEFFRFDRIGKFDPNTGEKLVDIDLIQMLIEADLLGIALANQIKATDIMHLNDVEVLSAEIADAFPMFSTGDLLLSSRHFNQIWVLDGKQHTLKWWFMGPMLDQHDPDFQPDGTITLLDNRPGREISKDPQDDGGKGGSRIVSIDPQTRTHQVLYASDQQNTFYTPYRGKHQKLANGNILITETDGGRVFEVNPEGEVVWSFINSWDETRVGWLMKATRYPESYKAIAELDCKTNEDQ